MRGLDARSVKTFFCPRIPTEIMQSMSANLSLSHSFSEEEKPHNTKNQHTLQVVTMCKVLYISIIHNVVAIICC